MDVHIVNELWEFAIIAPNLMTISEDFLTQLRVCILMLWDLDANSCTYSVMQDKIL